MSASSATPWEAVDEVIRRWGAGRSRVQPTRQPPPLTGVFQLLSAPVAVCDKLALSKEEAAGMLGISVDTLERRVLGDLATVRLGGRASRT